MPNVVDQVNSLATPLVYQLSFLFPPSLGKIGPTILMTTKTIGAANPSPSLLPPPQTMTRMIQPKGEFNLNDDKDDPARW